MSYQFGGPRSEMERIFRESYNTQKRERDIALLKNQQRGNMSYQLKGSELTIKCLDNGLCNEEEKNGFPSCIWNNNGLCKNDKVLENYAKNICQKINAMFHRLRQLEDDIVICDKIAIHPNIAVNSAIEQSAAWRDNLEKMGHTRSRKC